MEIMECCRVLRDYARFVEQGRTFMKTIPVNEAVEAAVAYCIEHDILRNFLTKNRANVVDVCIFEYNENCTWIFPMRLNKIFCKLLLTFLHAV